MAGVPAPLTKLNQAGQDALKQNLQGVSFSNSVPAPSPVGYAPSSNGIIGAMAGAANMAKTPPVGGMAGAMAGTPAVPKPPAATPSPAGDLGATLGKFAATFNAMPTGPSVPKFDAAGIAASRVAAQRAALANSVNAYDTSRKSAFDYMTKNTQDQRTLDNAMFHETNNPFSGKYQYDKTNILRNNNIQDTQNQANYQNDIAASDAKLAAFDAGAPGMQQDIENQLNQQNFTNTLAQNQDTRAQQTLDYNQSPTNPSNAGQLLNNQLTQLKLSDYPAQSQAAAQQTQQQLQAGQISNETAQFKLDQLKDPNSPTNQAAAIDTQLKQIDLKYADATARAKLDQIQKQIAQIGAAPYKSEADKQLDQVKLDTAKAELAKLQNPIPKPKTPDSYKTDPHFSEDVAHLKASPTDAAKLDSNPQPFIDAYGYDGYLALRKAAGLD